MWKLVNKIRYPGTLILVRDVGHFFDIMTSIVLQLQQIHNTSHTTSQSFRNNYKTNVILQNKQRNLLEHKQ